MQCLEKNITKKERNWKKIKNTKTNTVNLVWK